MRRAAARERGLLFPLSIGSEGSAQLGGNLSTNAGGLAVLRYGMTRDLVLGLEVVLPNGEVLSDLKGLRKDNTGYDLKALFLGRRRHAWRDHRCGAEAVPGAACARDGVARGEGRRRRLRVARQRAPRERRPGRVGGVRARRSLELVLRHVEGARDPFDEPREHYLLLELASSDTEDVLRAKLERILSAGLDEGAVLDGAIAQSEAQRAALWRLRERVPEAERRNGGSVKHDVSVRISRIPELIARAEPALARIAPHRLSIYGHIGDGNLHFNVLPPVGQTLEVFREGPAGKLSACVHDVAADLGGSFSAEHGVGLLKIDELERYKSKEALALMRAVKNALDPAGIMNPGKMLRRGGGA